ncbi:hypothetical protein [Methylosinus sp. C49]|uniref:hypothetical protein n=1 Tax=Methylosinus sp. C49 TaxID=2699395 RepID=UPI00137B5783|nr:hypothetical protein [Methylosinus sp. C49]
MEMTIGASRHPSPWELSRCGSLGVLLFLQSKNGSAVEQSLEGDAEVGVGLFPRELYCNRTDALALRNALEQSIIYPSSESGSEDAHARRLAVVDGHARLKVVAPVAAVEEADSRQNPVSHR